MTNGMPAPLELVDDDHANHVVHGPRGPTPRTPLGAATLWKDAVQDHRRYRAAVDRLTLRTADWANLDHVAAALAGRSLTSREHLDPDDRRIAHLKLIPAVAHTARAFDDVPLDDVLWLTLVRCPDGWWRIWSISPDRRPPAALVRDSNAWPYRSRRHDRARTRRRGPWTAPQ